MKRGNAQDWQKDPGSLTGLVQVWSENGIMMALRPKAAAQEMVKTGRAFVINEQAVGIYENE